MTHSTDARQRILGAALDLFAERGFSATTTAAIAQRASVAEKTLFAHFKSKNQLFEDTLSPAVLELAAPELVTSVLSTLGESWERLDQVLQSLIANRVEFATSHRAKLKLIIQEVLLRPELFLRFQMQGERDLLPRFVALTERLERLGELRSLPPSSVLRMVISVVVGYLVTRSILLPNVDWNDEREIDLMVGVLVDGLRPREGSTARVTAPRAAKAGNAKAAATARAKPRAISATPRARTRTRVESPQAARSR